MKVQILGARVRQLRELRDLTQGQLAYKADTTAAQISRIENNDRPGAQAVVVARIARALNTNTDYLMGLTGDSSPPSVKNGIDPELRATADELIAIWRELRKTDPESAQRLMRIAILQAEMVRAAARSATKIEQEDTREGRKHDPAQNSNPH